MGGRVNWTVKLWTTFFFIFLNIREENINITFKGAVLLYAFAQSITMPTQ